MALQKLLQKKAVGPYHQLPLLHIKVIMERQSPKVLKWDFKENSATPKIVKNNKTAIISDGVTIIKITLFEEFVSKVKVGQSYMVKGYQVRGDSPPFSLNIVRETSFFKSSPVRVDEGLVMEASERLFPKSTPVPLANALSAKGLITVEGNIVQVIETHL